MVRGNTVKKMSGKICSNEINEKFIREKLPKVYDELIKEGKEKGKEEGKREERERALKFIKMNSLGIPMSKIFYYYKSGITFEDFVLKISEEHEQSVAELKKSFNFYLGR